jgi:23S rRNA (pseudouridine1915-N3)-methyltransferase
MIKLYAIGKKTDYDPQINDYLKRLKKPFDTDLKVWNYSNSSTPREDESKHILDAITSQDFVILLDERGEELDNNQLLKTFQKPWQQGKNVVLIIGGAYGVSQELRNRADFMWSLGKLVLPHQMVRLILAEQIYRTYAISIGHPYHHI